MYEYIVVFSGIMGPYLKCDKIEALRTRIHYQPTDSEASGSMEELNIHLDEGVELLYTRETSRQLVLAQPPVVPPQPPQSEKGGS